jgi:tousled-like kinase
MSCDLVISCLFCRKGAQFVEAWLDGFAFTELAQKQEAVASHREELERQRKQLTKRKPGGQGQGGGGSGGKANRGGKQASAVASSSGGGDDGFAKPASLVSLTPQEYMERDELFKLRAALLKKVIVIIIILCVYCYL